MVVLPLPGEHAQGNYTILEGGPYAECKAKTATHVREGPAAVLCLGEASSGS
jgi:hypothetical protein